MDRKEDLLWYLANRKSLSDRHAGAWLVVLGKTVTQVFHTEKEAVEFAVRRYGIDVASVFQAVAKDPFIFA